EWNDGPGPGRQAITLSQDPEEFPGAVGEEERGNDEEDPPPPGDRPLELREPGTAQLERGLGQRTDARPPKLREQEALDPGGVILGIRNEHVVIVLAAGRSQSPDRHAAPLSSPPRR